MTPASPQRLTQRPGGRLQPDAVQLSAGPAGTLDAERVHALRLHRQSDGLHGVHFSNNRVDQQLTQANIGGDFLFNMNNPYLDAAHARRAGRARSNRDGTRTIQQGPIAYTTTPGDGRAILTAGRRLVELPFRHNVDDHNVWRMAIGVRGDLGSVSDKFPAQSRLRRVLHVRALGRQQPAGRQRLAQPLRRGIAIRRMARRRSRTSSARTSPKPRSTPSRSMRPT